MERMIHLGLDPWAAERGPGLRRCDCADCAEEGLYRAPKARDRLRDYYWFCLEHVREYNRCWDYLAGLSEREIELHLRRDTVWERPSWPLGARGLSGVRFDPQRMRDFFDLFEGEREEARGHAGRPVPYDSAAAAALAVFELEGPVTLVEVKARYKVLVKRHHPDTHGGDKIAEERLKVINQAYTTLKNSLVA